MYYVHIKNIAENIQQVLTFLPKEDDYDPMLNDDLTWEILNEEVRKYAINSGWIISENLSSVASRMVAGASLSIEESVNFSYRKDSFADMAWGAMLKDVQMEVQKTFPQFLEESNPCDRRN